MLFGSQDMTRATMTLCVVDNTWPGARLFFYTRKPVRACPIITHVTIVGSSTRNYCQRKTQELEKKNLTGHFTVKIVTWLLPKITISITNLLHYSNNFQFVFFMIKLLKKIVTCIFQNKWTNLPIFTYFYGKMVRKKYDYSFEFVWWR